MDYGLFVANDSQGLKSIAQQLSPPALVVTWLNVMHSKNMPNDIFIERSHLLCYYFGFIESAYVYVEQNKHNQKKAS